MKAFDNKSKSLITYIHHKEFHGVLFNLINSLKVYIELFKNYVMIIIYSYSIDEN